MTCKQRVKLAIEERINKGRIALASALRELADARDEGAVELALDNARLWEAAIGRLESAHHLTCSLKDDEFPEEQP